MENYYVNYFKEKKVIITGGAGFIGSHLANELLNLGCFVTIVDNFSSGNKDNLKELSGNASINIIDNDFTNPSEIVNILEGHHTIFHLAAYTDTRKSFDERKDAFFGSSLITFSILEGMAKAGIKDLIFLSSQLAYGKVNSTLFENYSPMKPNSIYGANKLANEALISAYAHLFDLNATILRLGNIMGGKMYRGIVFDFINKLKANPLSLEILGNGKQKRNYLLIDECIDAILCLASKEIKENFSVYLVGNEDQIPSLDVAKVVIEEMGLNDEVEIRLQKKSSGWKGDVPDFKFDISKIKALGWKPRLSSKEVIRECTRRLILENVG